MPSPTLFSLDEPLTPAEDRVEPTLWIKRLVIIPHRQLATDEAPIREVEFRRGLNIIQTRQRDPGETKVVGHSVGKTLLMRLIRYTLGEQHFATETVRNRIAIRFRTGFVVAHWRVDGQDWIVARPLNQAGSEKAFAARHDDWRAAQADSDRQCPHGDFLATVQQATIAGLDDFTLPHERRSPKWTDVLGWFARDSECGFRAHNEWRHALADSGHLLDKNDAGVLMQWLLGLMQSEEIRLLRSHQALLDERRDAKSQFDSARRFVETTGPVLFAKLEMSVEEAPPTNQDADLFSNRIADLAKDKVESLGRLKDDRREASNLKSLQDSEELLHASWQELESQHERTRGKLELALQNIDVQDNANARHPYDDKSRYEDCPEADCPMKTANRPPPKMDPFREELRREASRQVEEAKELIAALTPQRATRKAAYREATERTIAEKRRLDIEFAEIDRRIGQWESHRTDANSYTATCSRMNEGTKSIKGLDEKIEASYESQAKARQRQKAKLARLSSIYEQTLRVVFGDQALGKIVVDGNGVHPEPDSRLAPNGTALSVMTAVLAFDLSCVAASIAGKGNHPRFLLHDSPREGDMEEPLFHGLFRAVGRIEELFADREPSFQYIVTTTTAPPEKIAIEPFVRLTLDARDDAGLLLCMQF